MKNIITILLILFSATTFAQSQTSYVVPNIISLKAYAGKADRVYVSQRNEDYVICSPCTVDEVNIFAGVAGRKWMKVSDSAKANVGSGGGYIPKANYPIWVNPSDSSLNFKGDSLNAQLTYTNAVDTSLMSANPNNIPSVKWILPRLGGGGCPIRTYITPDSLYQVRDSCGIILDSTQIVGGYYSVSVAGVSQATISDTLKNYATGGSITTDNVIFSTPVALAVANHTMAGAFALKSQSSYVGFGNWTSGSATPTFGKIPIQAFNTTGTASSSTILYGDGIWKANTGWVTTGNAISSGQYVGTSNDQNLVFKRNGLTAFLVDSILRTRFYGDAEFVGGFRMSANAGSPFIQSLGTPGLAFSNYFGQTVAKIGGAGGSIFGDPNIEFLNIAGGTATLNYAAGSSKQRISFTAKSYNSTDDPYLDLSTASYYGKTPYVTINTSGTAGKILIGDNGNSQVSVGQTSTIPSSRIFQVVSTTKSSSPFPVMTATEKSAIASPQVGDHIYQSDGTEGVYVYKSTGWTFAY